MILCVEDDQAIRELMLYALRGAGYEAKGCTDSAALFATLETETPELILLDIMLPGEDGLSILNRLRTSRRCSAGPSPKPSRWCCVLRTWRWTGRPTPFWLLGSRWSLL